MKKRIACIVACILLITSIVTVFSGCVKSEQQQGGETNTNNTDKNESKVQYNRDPEDLGGFELNLLTVKSGMWNMHTDIAPTVYNGETINAAVYERNETVKGLYNAKITAHEDAEYYGMTERLNQDQLSG